MFDIFILITLFLSYKVVIKIKLDQSEVDKEINKMNALKHRCITLSAWAVLEQV